MKEKCYFGCKNQVLHGFPSPWGNNWKYFSKWKSVLDPVDQNNSNSFIEKNFWLCNNHFELKYRAGSRSLRDNAIPMTNNVHVQSEPIDKDCLSLSTKDDIIVHRVIGLKSYRNLHKQKPLSTQAMSPRQYTHSPVQNVNSHVQNVQSINSQVLNKQTVDSHVQNVSAADSGDVIFQIDDPDIDFDNFTYTLEQCDDNTFILHKKEVNHENELTKPEVKHDIELTQRQLKHNVELTNNGLFNEHDVKVTNRSSEQNVKLDNHVNFMKNLESIKGNTSLVQKVELSNISAEQNDAFHTFQNVVDDQTTGEVDTEVVWLPVSPKQQLQEFLDFIPKPSDNLATLNSKKDDRYTISKMELSKEWLKDASAPGFEQDRRLFNFICTKININEVTESKETIKNIISEISFQLSEMWLSSRNNEAVFFKKYHGWLNGPLVRFTPCTKSQKPSVDSRSPGNHDTPLLRMALETNADVFKFLKRSTPSFKPEMLYSILTSITNDITVENKNKLIKFCQRYVSDMKFKWLTADHKEDLFECKFEFWLHMNVRWPAFIQAIFDSKNPKAVKTEPPTYDPVLKYPMERLEKALTKKCKEGGQQDISEVMHRLLHHSDDAERLQELIADSKCSCITDSADLQKDPLQLEADTSTSDASELTPSIDISGSRPKKVYNPTEAHLDVLKQVLQKLKSDSEVVNPSPPKELNVTPEPEKEKVHLETQPTEESNTTSKSSPKSKELVLRPVLEKLQFLSECNIASGTKVKFRNQCATVVKLTNFKKGAVLVPISSVKRTTLVSPHSNSGVTMHAIQKSAKSPNAVAARPSSSQCSLKGVKANLIAKGLQSNQKAISSLSTPSNIISSSIKATSHVKIPKSNQKIINILATGKKLQETTNRPLAVKTKVAVHSLVHDISKGSLQPPTNLKSGTVRNIEIIPKITLQSRIAAVSALLADYKIECFPKKGSLSHNSEGTSPKKVKPSKMTEEPPSKAKRSKTAEEPPSKAKRSKTAEELSSIKPTLNETVDNFEVQELLPWSEFVDEDYEF